MNILLAEDNEANRLVVQALLERDGHALSFAENGQIALEICREQSFELILMDILMPVLDGVKALRRLRRSGGRNAKSPVFAFTAYSSADDRQRYKQVGFDLVLTKPLKPGDIDRAWTYYKEGGPMPEEGLKDDKVTNFKDVELVNPMMIDQLFKLGSAQNIAKIVQSFRQTVRLKRAEIQHHLVGAQNGLTDDLNRVRQASHAIKGAAATLGLSRVSRIAAHLQNAPPDKLAMLVRQLDASIIRTEDALVYVLKANVSKSGFAATRLSGADAPRA